MTGSLELLWKNWAWKRQRTRGNLEWSSRQRGQNCMELMRLEPGYCHVWWVAPDGRSIVTLGPAVDKTHRQAVGDHNGSSISGMVRMKLKSDSVGDSRSTSLFTRSGYHRSSRWWDQTIQQRIWVSRPTRDRKIMSDSRGQKLREMKETVRANQSKKTEWKTFHFWLKWTRENEGPSACLDCSEWWLLYRTCIGVVEWELVEPLTRSDRGSFCIWWAT